MVRSNCMPSEHANSGLELALRLDRELAEPLGHQLQSGLRDAIRSGRLRPGERLPPSRTLASDLGVSRSLVLDCYAQLRAEGYLNTRVGSGTVVAAAAAAAPSPAATAHDVPRLVADFRYGVPDLAGFPMRDWLWALSRAGHQAAATTLDYGDPRGNAIAREAIAAYLRRVRSVSAEPSQIVICAGYAQGINLILRALARAGMQQVGIEDPGDRDNDAIATRARLEPVPIPVDWLGIDVTALSATSAGAVIVTPAHQAPTGVVLAPERRHALVRWANERAAVIIEDEYDAEFRYDRQPVGSMQGLAPQWVACLGTVSKSLAPGLRLGWIVCPPQLADAVALEKDLADRGTPCLDQMALAALIESGRYDRHLRRMRAVYAHRRQALGEALRRHAPSVQLTGLAAGFHAVAHLPASASEQQVISRARKRMVGLYGMSRYRANGATHPPQLVLSFGNLNESAIERGIATVGDLLRGE